LKQQRHAIVSRKKIRTAGILNFPTYKIRFTEKGISIIMTYFHKKKFTALVCRSYNLKL